MAKEFRQNLLESTQSWVPIRYIKDGIIENSEKSFCILLEIYPINYELKSDIEKRAAILPYHQLLKKNPARQQIFCRGQKTDIEKYLDELNYSLSIEPNESARALINSHIEFVQENMRHESVSVRYFQIIEFSKSMLGDAGFNIGFSDVKNTLMETSDYYRNIFEEIGIDIKQDYTNTTDEEVASYFYQFLNRRKAELGYLGRPLGTAFDLERSEIEAKEIQEKEYEHENAEKRKKQLITTVGVVIFGVVLLLTYFLQSAFGAFRKGPGETEPLPDYTFNVEVVDGRTTETTERVRNTIVPTEPDLEKLELSPIEETTKETEDPFVDLAPAPLFEILPPTKPTAPEPTIPRETTPRNQGETTETTNESVATATVAPTVPTVTSQAQTIPPPAPSVPVAPPPTQGVVVEELDLPFD